ncbi:unnamed protein product [Caenorhabditis bovis]|uniref:Uncharacterized protein n=1 Tax=Caenorhabditis bovis TaxID=2654633 RepID=A0A8S1EEM8_9PELO|nr:unnamed protein product [Caenorhabditis bovis]
MRRNSLTSMLGEFVGLQRSPDFRLSSRSHQEIDEAVQDEKRDFERPKLKPRQRYMSEGDVTISRNEPRIEFDRAGSVVDEAAVVMRNKNRALRKDRPTSLIDRIRQKITHTKTGAITESDEEDEQPTFVRNPSTRSERLLIHITPVETVPIRVVQVSQ